MNLNRIAISHGLLVGAIQAGLMLVAYLVNTNFLFSGWMSFGTWMLVFMALYLGLRGVREAEGGELGFSRAWGHALAIAASMTAVVTLANMLLYNVIDPNLVELAIDYTLERIEEFSNAFGGSAMDLNALTDEIEASARETMTPVGLIKAGAMSMVFYLIPALIMAAVMKRAPRIETL